jgi:hypothetical protein
MGEELTRVRSRLIHRTQIPVEENTSVLVSLQHAAFFLGFDGIVAHELMEFEAEETAKVINVAVRDLGCRYTATVATRSAINLIFHFLCDRFESAFHEVVSLEPGAEASVLFAVFLPVALDLYEVC